MLSVFSEMVCCLQCQGFEAHELESMRQGCPGRWKGTSAFEGWTNLSLPSFPCNEVTSNAVSCSSRQWTFDFVWLCWEFVFIIKHTFCIFFHMSLNSNFPLKVHRFSSQSETTKQTPPQNHLTVARKTLSSKDKWNKSRNSTGRPVTHWEKDSGGLISQFLY